MALSPAQVTSILRRSIRGGDGTYVISTKFWPEIAAFFGVQPSQLSIQPKSGPFAGTKLASMASFHAVPGTNPSDNFPTGAIPGLALPAAVGQAGGDFSVTAPWQGLSDAVSSVTDFLKALTWLINPLNWLRMVEFLTGLIFIIVGAHSMMQAFGESRGRFYGYGSVFRRGIIGRAFRVNRGETDVERVRRRSQQRQESRGRNTETGRASHRSKTGGYARSSERGNRRSDRDSRRNARRSKSK